MQSERREEGQHGRRSCRRSGKRHLDAVGCPNPAADNAAQPAPMTKNPQIAAAQYRSVVDVLADFYVAAGNDPGLMNKRGFKASSGLEPGAGAKNTPADKEIPTGLHPGTGFNTAFYPYVSAGLGVETGFKGSLYQKVVGGADMARTVVDIAVDDH